MKVKRNIIHIDEEKCNGCGLCVPACEEGALQIVGGKARLVKEIYCDGLGNCLGECPQDAITIEEREADPFDEEAVAAHLKAHSKAAEAAPSAGGCGGGCPGSAIMDLMRGKEPGKSIPQNQDSPDSALRQWPVQLQLVNPDAPYWQDADLLIAADCVPVAYGGFHGELLTGRRVIIACPKLDDTSSYAGKLAALFSRNRIKSVTVAHMEVPCCNGLGQIVRAAAEAAGLDVEIDDVCISVRGEKL